MSRTTTQPVDEARRAANATGGLVACADCGGLGWLGTQIVAYSGEAVQRRCVTCKGSGRAVPEDQGDLFDVPVHEGAAMTTEPIIIHLERDPKFGEASDDETAHVRALARGFIAELVEGRLPLGFVLRVETAGPAGSQHDFTGNPTRPPKNVEVPVDRFAAIVEDVCETCVLEGRGRRAIVDQGDGRWYHVEPCADPEPGGMLVDLAAVPGPADGVETPADGSWAEVVGDGSGEALPPLGADGYPDALHG